MHESSDTNRSKEWASFASSRGVLLVVFLVVAAAVVVRAGSEIGMMSQHGSDPQMPIWYMVMAVKLAVWSLAGGLLMLLLVAVRKNRWGRVTGLVLLLAWLVAICASSWGYQKGAQALADADDPSTSAARLNELVQFDGIQAGYELDNRLASHPNTPPEALRNLYDRDQLGTQMSLARNPNTPRDILEQLVKHEDELVHRGLADNPNLPESVRGRLRDHR